MVSANPTASQSHSILLVLSSTRPAPSALATALDRARGGTLSVLFVYDARSTKKLASRLNTFGLVGPEDTGAIESVLRAEYLRRAGEQMELILNRATQAGVFCATQIAEGDFTEIVQKTVAAEKVAAVLVVHQRRSHMSRLLAQAQFESLRAQLTVPVEVVEEP
jgi:nucleotide-binding universal stress UspA family protein